jgi:hypothetical protein
LKLGTTLTPIEALDLYGCFRLSARIYDLKDQGWPIRCEKKELLNGKRVGHYSLEQNKMWWPIHSIANKYEIAMEEMKSNQMEARV